MILGITPARGGSKGVPGKNIRMLAGKPLIAWTIEAALACPLLDRYIVSTEDSEIARVAQKHGAEVLDRPQELATDEVPTLSVLQHVLTQVPADTVVVLQATSPIRDPDLLERCIRRFQETQADSLATGFICKFTEYGTNHLPRQQIPGFFHNDGSVYVIRGDLIRQGERYGKKLGKMVTDKEQNMEIDEEFDFWLAEKVLGRRLNRAEALR